MRNAIFFNGGFEEIGISFWPNIRSCIFLLCAAAAAQQQRHQRVREMMGAPLYRGAAALCAPNNLMVGNTIHHDQRKFLLYCTQNYQRTY